MPPLVSSAGQQEKPRILTNHFHGDATFDRPDGINLSLISYQATWQLHPSDADALLFFLRAHLAIWFLWTMPRESAPRIWEAIEWSRQSDYDFDTIQATFEERLRP
jgi:phage-related protein